MLEKINQVNELLQTMGRRVIQKVQIGNRPAYFSYKPQYVFDAVNEVFGPENWNYELHDNELFPSGDDGQSGQAVVSVEVFLRSGSESEFVSHGIQYGQSQIVFGNIGDARKGAITDAVQKGLSGFSIAKMAYRGELGAAHGNGTDHGNKQTSPRSQLQALLHHPNRQEQEASPPVNQEDTNGLPKLPNVQYETEKDGTILALGDTYNNRPLLKSMGFRWLPQEKAWGLKQAA